MESLNAEKAIGDLRVKAADTKARMNIEVAKLVRANQTGNEALAQQIEGHLINRRKNLLQENKAIMDHGVQLYIAQAQMRAALKSNASTRKDRIEREYYGAKWGEFKNAYDGAKLDAGKRKALNDYKSFFNYIPGQNMLDPSQPRREGFQKIFAADPELKKSSSMNFAAANYMVGQRSVAQKVTEDADDKAGNFLKARNAKDDAKFKVWAARNNITVPKKYDRESPEHKNMLKRYFRETDQRYAGDVKTVIDQMYGTGGGTTPKRVQINPKGKID
jgi:hypothetical protein